mmetsp:Transcript_4200/g.10014  ORF Transcript_4200/g.10014 Transcript_4200/m.10014 type:complete len:86 (-) Transcript_4200:148-405(-)
MAAKESVLALYRNMMRESRRMMDYNFRNYSMRRVRQGFQEARTSPNPEIQYHQGVTSLQMLRRQSAISQMYASPQAYVMDSITKH